VSALTYPDVSNVGSRLVLRLLKVRKLGEEDGVLGADVWPRVLGVDPRRRGGDHSRTPPEHAALSRTLLRPPYDEGEAVAVPGMSWPQYGWSDTGTNPFFSARMYQAHCSGVLWPKIVE